jgi:PASTA domain-containing protein
MRKQALLYVLVAALIGLATGCGGGTTTASTSPDPEVTAAKKELRLAYRVADSARVHGLRCDLSPSPSCRHPRWYPPVGSLVAEVGSEKLHQLRVAFVNPNDRALRAGVTYIVKARRKSVVMAHETSSGTILVLHGSPSGSAFTRAAGSASILNAASSPAQRPTVSVPDVRGMPLSAAERKLKAAKLGWSFGYRFGQSPPGSQIVRGQDPEPGTRQSQWEPVELHFHRK